MTRMKMMMMTTILLPPTRSHCCEHSRGVFSPTGLPWGVLELPGLDARKEA